MIVHLKKYSVSKNLCVATDKIAMFYIKIHDNNFIFIALVFLQLLLFLGGKVSSTKCIKVCTVSAVCVIFISYFSYLSKIKTSHVSNTTYIDLLFIRNKI